MDFTLYPAIDIRDGRVVRLVQGDYAQETEYSSQPLAVAKQCSDAGACWLHLVDLDAARDGGYTLAPLLLKLVAETGLKVQTGGGIRGLDDARRVLDAGASRVVVGSLAIREPEAVAGWLRALGADHVTIALDARFVDGQWRLPTHGWTATSERTLDDLARFYADAGLRHLLCTDIGRDGMLTGPNIDLYAHLVGLLPGVAVQASGGVRDVADINAARKAGCAGAVLGKALLEGRFQLQEALTC